MAADLRFVAYCGLYCRLCAQCGRIPHQANDLRQSMAKEGFDIWGKEIPGFNEFWKFLTGLSHQGCGGCRQGGGAGFCGLRKCTRQRKVDTCPLCDEFPCGKVLQLAEGYPMLVADGKRMKEIGIEKWIKEQKQRETTGFAYVDTRCHPYTVPTE